MEKPLYTEKHYTLGPIIKLGVTLATIAFVMIMFAFDVKRLLPVGSDWIDIWNGMIGAMSHQGPIRTIWAGWANSALFLGLLVLLFYVFGMWSRAVMTVDYYKDRLVVHGVKRKRTIFYKDIKEIWKGFYFCTGGSRYRRVRIWLEKYPGGDPDRIRKKLNKREDYQQVDNILTWSGSRERYSKRHGTPLMIHYTGHWNMLHMRNEEAVIKILKENASWIKMPEYWK